MVSHCANPRCGAPFLYFRNGRLFVAPRKNAPSIEYFWLCGDCAEELDLQFAGSDDFPPIVVARHAGVCGPDHQVDY